MKKHIKNSHFLAAKVPVDLYEGLQKICEERKKKGLPTGSMRFVVCEAIQKYLQCLNENR